MRRSTDSVEDHVNVALAPGSMPVAMSKMRGLFARIQSALQFAKLGIFVDHVTTEDTSCVIVATTMPRNGAMSRVWFAVFVTVLAMSLASMACFFGL